MEEENRMKRVENPEGHQVCQLDEAHRTVAIRNKKYKTVIHFLDSGKVDVQHTRVWQSHKDLTSS